MATITVTELFPHPGKVWARVVALWETWLANAALTWITPTTAAVNSRRTMKVSWSDATDTYEWVLMDVSTSSTAVYDFIAFSALPDIMKSPGFLATTVAGRTTINEFTSKLFGARNVMTAAWLGFAGPASVNNDTTFNGPITINARTITKYYSSNFRWWIDALSVTVGTVTATVTVPDSANLSPNIRAESISLTSAGGGGGSTDLSGVVAALEDIARRDVATSIDNGKVTVYNYSGDIVEPP